MRAHFTRPVTDEQGDLLPNVQVTLFDPATTTPIAQTVYSTDVGNNVVSNPFVSNTGVIDFYLDLPARVRIGLVQGNLPMQFYEDVDVIAAGSDSVHAGVGINSLVIGSGASTPGDSATAVGPAASAGGTNATALGKSSNATGEYSTALGTAASAQSLSGTAVGRTASSTGEAATAVGRGADAGALSATALGDGASAPYAHSTAVGAGAETSGENQIMMGTPDDVTEIPAGSGIVLTAPGGTRWKITIADDGGLTTAAL